MAHSHAHDVKKEVKGYILVFAALAVLTIVTVAVKYLHLSLFPAICLALLIATVKGSLVACYFMHLISEKKLVYFILIFTAVNLVVLAVLVISGYLDTQNGVKFVS